MSDYSQSPLEVLAASLARGYTGLHVEQGVPVLDRDLNLIQDLLAEGIRSVLARFVGDGAQADAEAFTIGPTTPPSANFAINGPGSLLLRGLEVRNPGNDLTYLSQPANPGGPSVPPLTTPAAAPDPRVDTVYLEAWQTEVDDSADPDLGNPLDIGMRTSVRLKRTWVVLVAEGIPVPAPAPGHDIYPLAELRRPVGQATITRDMIADLRQTRLTVASLEQRLALMERILLLPSFAPQGGPLAQFLPQTGAVGTTVQINGFNLDIGDISVFFGGVRAQLVGAPTANQLAALVPGGLTPAGVITAVRITLRNEGGQQVSDDMFLARPDPVFADRGGQFSPKHGTPGSNVTLNGFNFNFGPVKVTFDAAGQSVAATLVGAPTPTQVTVQVPSGLVPAILPFADVKITITTGTGKSDTSDDTFRAEVNAPAPAFSASPQFLPQSGSPQSNVRLTGSNFSVPPVSVHFDPAGLNIQATIVGAPSATQIAVVVPSGLIQPGQTKSVAIAVTTGGGSVTSTDTFIVH
jgi:hypothetical protein